MPKKKRRCEHPYYEWDVAGRLAKKPCPHPYFGPGKDPDTSEEIDCCIFHASMEAKKESLGIFWFKFWRLFAKAKKDVEATETEEEKKNVWLECFGFIFPDAGGRFYYRDFPFRVNMRGAVFPGTARFSRVRFSGGAYFERTKFLSDADFSLAQFPGDTCFRSARFSGIANFWGAEFLGDADFTFTEFEEKATFRFASITGTIRFKENEFLKDADFRLFGTDKHEVGGKELGPGKLLFDHAYFHIPNRVPVGGKALSFIPGGLTRTDLRRWSFRGTNIERVRFVEPCWPEEKERKGRKRTLDEERAEKGEISWAEAGEVYRKLRKNFEDGLAYEAAGDFHVGQMECRLRDRNRKIWDRALTFAYKLISGYGENIGRPFSCLVGTAVLFGLLSLFHGFPTTDGSGVNWDVNLYKTFDGTQKVIDIEPVVSFTARAAVSFGIPGHDGNSPYCDDTLYILTFIWKILAVVFVTFFVLALRRRFRR
jgi:uncharacterized protein YjbI with pentapeptide repeats